MINSFSTRPLQIKVAVHFQRHFHAQPLPRTQPCCYYHLHLPIQQTHCMWPTASNPTTSCTVPGYCVFNTVSVSQGSAPRMTAGTNCRYEVDWVTEYACHRDYLESHSCKLSSEQHDLSIDLTPLTLSCKYSPLLLLLLLLFCLQVRPGYSSIFPFVGHSLLHFLICILQLFLFPHIASSFFFFSDPSVKMINPFLVLKKTHVVPYCLDDVMCTCKLIDQGWDLLWPTSLEDRTIENELNLTKWHDQLFPLMTLTTRKNG